MTGTSTAAETSKKKQKAMPTKAITAFVVPGSKPLPAAGLFVIFRAATPAEDSAFAQIVAATTTTPADESTEGAQGSGGSTTSEQPSTDPTTEQAAPPRRPYALGRCDDKGVLGAIDTEAGTQRSDSYKLVGKYEIFYVHHPDVEVAKRWLERVETEPGDLKPHEVDVTGNEVTLPTKASDYLQDGSPRYGGWVLFRGTPLGLIPEVRTAVTALQADLGKLRYVVGNDNDPYAPQKAPDKNRPNTSGMEYEDHTLEPVDGMFSARTFAGVYAFQHHAREGRLLKLAGVPATSWDYLDTEREPVRLAAEPPRRDGVADKETADAIVEALDGHLRKPDAILIQVAANKGGYQCWVRQEAALAYRAWDALVIAMGAPRGVNFGSSFRSIYNSVISANPGKAVMSPHKTGLAIDLEMIKGYKPGNPTFPVAMVHDIREADGKEGFRLFIPSSEAVPSAASRDDASAALAARIQAAVEAAEGPREMKGVRPLADLILADLADPESFWSTYYKASINPWEWQDTATGGAEGKPTLPPAPARGWLDVTRLGELAGLHPIPALNGWKHAWSKTGTSKDLPGLLALMTTAKAQHDIEDAPPPAPLKLAEAPPGEIATDLESLLFQKKPPVPVEPDRPVSIEPKKDSFVVLQSTSVQFKHIDLALLERWRAALAEVGTSGRVRAAGAILEVALSARPECEVLKKAALFLGPFGQEELVGNVKGVLEVDSGRMWMTRLSEIQSELEPPAKKTDGSKPSKRPDEKLYVVRLGLNVSKGDARVVFDHEDTVLVPISTGGVQRCQEWWHFQHAEAKHWVSCLDALGCPTECLWKEEIPGTYGRTGIGYTKPKPKGT